MRDRPTLSERVKLRKSLRVVMPTRMIWLSGAAAFAVGLTACGQSPTGPTPQGPPTAPAPEAPPTPGVTLSGTVLDFTDSDKGRPVPNLRLKVRSAGPRDGAVGGVELADVVTDGEGRYTITDVSARQVFFQTVTGSDYRFPCDFYPVVLFAASPGLPLNDLPVVRASWSGTRPPAWWIVGTSVYGIVSERVDGRLRPLAGATVTLDNEIQDPSATSNANGFYMVCSTVGGDQFRDISAQKGGYSPVARRIFGGWDYEVDFELSRE